MPEARGRIDGIIERRRAPRGQIGEASWLAMPSTWRVELLDVSLGGLAFTSPYALEVGRTASIRATLARDAFNAQVRVCWSRPRGPGSSIPAEFEIGAVFLSLEDSSRRTLYSFLKCSPPQES